MSDSVLREKTVRWADPTAGTRALRGLSGLEAMRALQSGHVSAPPIINLFGFEPEIVELGKVSFSSVPDESHFNLLGMVHGGTMATLLDTVMGCAVHTQLAAGRGYTTLNISVNYIRPITLKTVKVFAEGVTVHVGRTTAIATGRVVDAAGKLFATGETTCLLFDIAD
ncbi:MAG: PaaI family thioesterase [Gemmatimonadaceae bacterium]